MFLVDSQARGSEDGARRSRGGACKMIIYIYIYIYIYSRTCRAWKGFAETERRRSTGRQPGTKSASRPAVKPVINRLSNGRCVPPFPDMPCMRRVYRDLHRISLVRASGYLHRISLVRASGESFNRLVFDACGSNCSVGVPARPRPAAPPCAPTRPAHGISGFWNPQL